jgi:cathepsin B
MFRIAAFTAVVGIAAAGSTEKVKAIHKTERMARITEINAMEGVGWTAGVNSRFETEPIGASKSLCGVKGNHTEDIARAVLAGEVEPFVPTWSATAPIPDSFDSATNFDMCSKIIDDIRDQSNCGCCWAFGGAEAASDRMCIATKGKLMFPLSAQDVCFCANPDGCGGGQITTPWDFIKRSGAVSGGQYQGSGPFGKGMCQDFTLPHCHHHGPKGNDPYPAEGQPGCMSQSSPKCSRKCDADATGTFDKYTFKGQVQTASGEKAIQQMIMEGGPVETAFTVYSDFEDYAGGVYHHVSGQMMGGHAVKFVGWGVDPSAGPYWKVANSWNPFWGEKGYFRIKRGDSEGGIEDGVTGSSADATWAKKGPWEN